MTDIELELPSEWVQHTGEQQQNALAEIQQETETGTVFVVSVQQQVSSDGYALRFSTISPTQVRHDYPVTEYSSEEEALVAVEAFAEHVSARLDDGTLSPTDPDIGEIHDVIESFTGNRHLLAIQRFIHRLW